MLFVLREFVTDGLLDEDRARSDQPHSVDHAGDEVRPVEAVQHNDLEPWRGHALYLFRGSALWSYCSANSTLPGRAFAMGYDPTSDDGSRSSVTNPAERSACLCA